MNQSEPLDYNSSQATKAKRPLIITIICIAGLIISLLELAGNLFTSYYIEPLFENDLTICLKLIPLINIICFVGFWFLRKAALILFSLNIFFTMWVHYRIGVSPFDFYTLLYIIFAIVIASKLNTMTKFI